MSLLRSLLRRVVPQSARIALRTWQMRALLPRAGRRRPATREDRVTVVGYLTSPTGLGEGARLCATCLANMGLTVGLIDVTGLLGAPSGVAFPSDGGSFVAGDAGGPLICHVNPPDFQIALSCLKLSGRSRTLFAHWVWELPLVGHAWKNAFRLIHEAWVPSVFVADALRGSGCTVPIRIVPYPLARPPSHAPVRAQRGRRFTVLTIFAFESGFDRKNPIAAIAAFKRAFGARDDVRLVLKVRGASVSGEPERRLHAELRDCRNIDVVDRRLDPDEIDALIEDADVLLSMHRAEGFGLPLADAMLRGKPVVATAWSGNLDFMADGAACLVPNALVPAADETLAYRGLRAMWADPSVGAAAEWLQRLEADAALRAAVGAAASAYAALRLGPEVYAQAIASALGRAETRR